MDDGGEAKGEPATVPEFGDLARACRICRGEA